MKAEILTIGDEILIGQTVNSNAAYIGNELSTRNIDVIQHTVVGDNLQQIVDALTEAWERADLILVTGGLGPTHDDITRDALCVFFQTDLEYHGDIVDEIQQRYRRRNREMPEIVKNQGYIPRGAIRISNTIGSAVGIRFNRLGKTLIAMPGVPIEMQLMMTQSIIPSLTRVAPEEYIVMKRIKTYGLFESQLVEKLHSLEQIRESVSVAILPRVTGVELRLTARAESGDSAKKRVAEAEKIIISELGSCVFGSDSDTLESIVSSLLIGTNQSVATAESCTGGLVAKMLTDVAGSSACFLGSVISYSNDVKTDILGVPRQIIDSKGAVSKEVAVAMAVGVREKLHTDYGLATTGIAGPGGGTPDKPMGLVHIAVAGPNGVTHDSFVYPMNRELNRIRFSCSVLDLLRLELLQQLDQT